MFRVSDCLIVHLPWRFRLGICGVYVNLSIVEVKIYLYIYNGIYMSILGYIDLRNSIRDLELVWWSLVWINVALNLCLSQALHARWTSLHRRQISQAGGVSKCLVFIFILMHSCVTTSYFSLVVNGVMHLELGLDAHPFELGPCHYYQRTKCRNFYYNIQIYLIFENLTPKFKINNPKLV